MSTCDLDGCPGHLGKFSSCLAEAVWSESMNGMHDSTGSTEAYGHFTLVVFPETDTVIVDDSTGRTVTVLAGAYIVESTDQGAVWLHTFDTEEAAREAYEAHGAAYEEWLGDDEDSV